jgi:CRP/FNR family transcriptional regulator, cyclic AMP receptor protein
MDNLLDICADLPRLAVAAGSCVVEQGRRIGSLFVLVDGEVAVERDGVEIAGVKAAGSIFGEVASLLDRPAVITARAKVDSVFLVAEDGAAYLAERPEVTIVVARVLAARLDTMSGYLDDVKHQYGHQSDHLGLLHEVLGTLMHDRPAVVRPGSARMPETDY